MRKTANRRKLRLSTIGYRDAVTEKRLAPETFYRRLPKKAAVVDIRAHPYSPFAPEYTGRRVAKAIEAWKTGVKTFHHLRALGNTHKDSSGQRRSPPIYVDAEAGFAQLEAYIKQYKDVVIFCACSYATRDSDTHRCHRFFVAEEMARRLQGLIVEHLEEK